MSDGGYVGIFVLMAFVVYLCYNHWGTERDEWKRKYEELSRKIEGEDFEKRSRLTPSQKKQVDEYFGKRPTVNKKKK